MVRIELMNWEHARAEASRIRFKVFVEEQRVPEEMEMDEIDPQCVHALAYSLDGKVVATGRLLPDGHIGRLAVLKEWRGKGIGGEVLDRLVAAARERGVVEVALSAQMHALEFYRRHGFIDEGDVYEEAGIPHQLMRKILVPTA